MKKIKTAALKEFNDAYETEIKNFHNAYLRSLEIYEKSMESFILKHIVKGGDFESLKKNAWVVEYDCLDKDSITELNLLEEMIRQEYYWLKEGQFNCVDTE